MALDKVLKVEHVDGEIRISIGLEALAFAIEYGPDWYDSYKVDKTDNYRDFGNSILYRLTYEEEDGMTPVYRLFDEVSFDALDQGDEGFIEVDDEIPE